MGSTVLIFSVAGFPLPKLNNSERQVPSGTMSLVVSFMSMSLPGLLLMCCRKISIIIMSKFVICKVAGSLAINFRGLP
jgi:hypothetical protein